METDTRIAEQAAEWLLRLEEDGGAQCRAEFFEWLKQSAWHVREFLLVTEEWRGLDGMDAARRIDVRKLIGESRDNVVPLETENAPQLDKGAGNRAQRGRLWLLAAALGVFAVCASWFVVRNMGAHSYVTGVGEQRSFQLNDGSVLHLNAGTRVKVDYSKQLRELTLVEGEALFVVGRDPARPFRVSAGAATIQALGTQFNVYRRGSGATVSVLEGAVQVSSDRLPMRLDAGEEAEVAIANDAANDARALKRARPDISKAVAWRQRQLVFRDDPLGEVAAQFNRYNRVKISVEGDAARAKQLVGVFDADDPQSLMLFLAKDPSLTIERDGDRMVIKGAAPAGAAR